MNDKLRYFGGVGLTMVNNCRVSNEKLIEEQRAIRHNQLRYAELQKLRMGQPNRYEETRYR